jgi:16S rRNA (uracil1498-N3)-methyltransferase
MTRMHRFYLPNLESLVLTGAEAHHCVQVLRLRVRDVAQVFDGAGNAVDCQIAAVQQGAVHLTPLRRFHTPPLRCRLTLAQAIPKKNMDLIVQKATELGLARIVPLITERTVAQVTDASRKLERWREIALESCKQCGNHWLPEIGAPQTLDKFLTVAGAFDLKLVAALLPEAQSLKKLLAHSPARPLAASSVLALVGPEGDFTPAEYDAARAAGCRPLSLGSLVLRADTAALYTLSILHHELQAA